MTSGVWEARYADLAGKTALVAGVGAGIVEVVSALAANSALIGVIAADRAVVDAALATADGVNAMGVVAAPDDPATWARVVPHAEQRLGPIDVVVAIGRRPDRQAVVDATLPDMAARRRGVVIEVGESGEASTPSFGVRRRFVAVDADTASSDIAAAVALCASDVLTAPAATIALTP